MKFLAWAKRTDGEDCPERWDIAVRDSAADRHTKIDAKYPVEGWMQGNHTGGQLSVSIEQFSGSFPVWIWEA